MNVINERVESRTNMDSRIKYGVNEKGNKQEKKAT